MKTKLYCFALCLGVLSRMATAQDISTEMPFNKISDTLAVVNVSGTNVGVVSSAKGVVLIDPAIDAENKQSFLDLLQGFSDSPVKYIVNTHSDLDHSRGNKALSATGASVLSSRKARFSQAYTQLTFDNGLKIDLESHQLRALSVVSHSHDDWIIYFAEENTLFTGDIFTSAGHPEFYIGGLAGLRRSVNKILALANDETRIVPGHGDISTIDGVRSYMANTSELYKVVRSLHQSGNSAEQIQADAKYQEAMLRFNVDGDENFLNRADVRRFVPKVISAEFIKSQDIDLEVSQRIIGRYALRDRSIIEVVYENDRYYARKEGEFLHELIPQSDTSFHVRASIGGLATFIPNAKNTKIRQLELNLDGTSYLARKQR